MTLPAEMFNYREGKKTPIPTLNPDKTTIDGETATEELDAFCPQDEIAQNLYRALRMGGHYPDNALSHTLAACAARPLQANINVELERIGEYVRLTAGENHDLIGEWLSIPLQTGKVAGVTCPHCGGFAQVEQTIDAAPIDIVYIPETVYIAADQVGPGEGQDADRAGGADPLP